MNSNANNSDDNKQIRWMQSDKDIFCGWSQHTDEHEPRSHFALLQHLQNMNHMHNLSHLTHIHHLNQFTLLKQEVNLIDVKRKKAIRLLPIRVAGEENQEETSKNKIVKTRAKSKAEGTGATVLLPLHSVRTIDKELLRGRQVCFQKKNKKRFKDQFVDIFQQMRLCKASVSLKKMDDIGKMRGRQHKIQLLNKLYRQ